MNDDLTTRLTRQLHDQVDDWSAHPLTLEGVQGRARSIRRTRRALAGGAVAAAVLAIVVPLGLTQSSPDSQRPPVTNTPTEKPTGDVVAESPLAIPFIEGRTLTLPDGVTAELPEAYQGGTVLGETVFGLRSDESGNLVLDELDVALGIAETVPLDSGFAPNLEGDAIAYVTEGQLTIEWEDGVSTRMGQVGPVEVVRLVGGPDCTMGTDDCVVYYNDGETPRFLNNSGEGAEVPGAPLSVSDVDDDRRVAMLTEVTAEPGSCGRVYDQQSRQEAFATCEYSLGRFSPDGDHLSATQPYRGRFR